MNHDRELVRRGVIVPVFKTKPPTDILNFKFKDKYYLSYLKARSKVRALKLGNTEEWKKYCYLQTLNDKFLHYQQFDCIEQNHNLKYVLRIYPLLH